MYVFVRYNNKSHHFIPQKYQLVAALVSHMTSTSFMKSSSKEVLSEKSLFEHKTAVVVGFFAVSCKIIGLYLAEHQIRQC